MLRGIDRVRKMALINPAGRYKIFDAIIIGILAINADHEEEEAAPTWALRALRHVSAGRELLGRSSALAD